MGLIATKRAQKEAEKLSLNNQKLIWPEHNLVIACHLCSFTSISHISLISTLNWHLFEALDSWRPNHIWFAPKISQEVALIFSWSQYHYAAMLLCNLDSIGYNSLVSTLNYDPFEALDFGHPKIQNHRWFARRKS